MKKYLYVFLSLLIFCSCNSSEDDIINTASQHLTFLDVPIDGKLSSFVNKMEDKGFLRMGQVGDTYYMEGQFGIYPNCMLAIGANKKKNVSFVYVYYPPKTSVRDLKRDFDSLKSMFINKYSSPDVDNIPDIEEYGLLDYLYSGSEDCYLGWILPYGEVGVGMLYAKDYGYCAVAAYEDKVNMEEYMNGV